MYQCSFTQWNSELSFLPFQVSLVDKDLLKFVKLEELILSANRIKEVNAANLPPTLKVKEPISISSLGASAPNPTPRRFGHHDCVPRTNPRLLRRSDSSKNST